MGRDEDRESTLPPSDPGAGAGPLTGPVNPVVLAVGKAVTKAAGSPRRHLRFSVAAAERIWPSVSQSTRKLHRPYFAHGPLKAPP